MRNVAIFSALAALAALPAPALAQSEIVSDSGDTAWMLTASVVVLLLVLPGLVLRHFSFAGPRAALPGFAIPAAVSLLWIAIGYSIAFAPGTGILGGFSNLFLSNLTDIREALTVPESAFVLFQMTLAMLAPLLLSGAYAGRAQIGWTIGFSLAWSLIVYAPVAHWLWGGGWLANLGAIDFAGGIVIQTSVGISALVLGRMFAAQKPPAGHTMPLAMTGAVLLWVGWLILVGGWALAATDDAASAIINTHLAACSAAFTWALAERLRTGGTSAMGLATGALAGIAAIVGAAGYVGPAGAIAIGIMGAALAFMAARPVRKWLRIADPLHLFATSGVAGIAGSLLVAFFAFPVLGGPGLEGEGTMISQLVTQAVAVIAVSVWSVIGTLIAAFGVAMIAPMTQADGSAADVVEPAPDAT